MMELNVLTVEVGFIQPESSFLQKVKHQRIYPEYLQNAIANDRYLPKSGASFGEIVSNLMLCPAPEKMTYNLYTEKTKDGKINVIMHDMEINKKFRVAQFEGKNATEMAETFIQEYKDIKEIKIPKPRSKKNNIWKRIKNKIN